MIFKPNNFLIIIPVVFIFVLLLPGKSFAGYSLIPEINFYYSGTSGINDVLSKKYEAYMKSAGYEYGIIDYDDNAKGGEIKLSLLDLSSPVNYAWFLKYRLALFESKQDFYKLESDYLNGAAPIKDSEEVAWHQIGIGSGISGKIFSDTTFLEFSWIFSCEMMAGNGFEAVWGLGAEMKVKQYLLSNLYLNFGPGVTWLFGDANGSNYYLLAGIGYEFSFDNKQQK